LASERAIESKWKSKIVLAIGFSCRESQSVFDDLIQMARGSETNTISTSLSVRFARSRVHQRNLPG
jgi:hypothetical protein